MNKLVKLGCMLVAILGFITTANGYEGYSPIPTGGTGGKVMCENAQRRK
jgi:hypothetical protein